MWVTGVYCYWRFYGEWREAKVKAVYFGNTSCDVWRGVFKGYGK